MVVAAARPQASLSGLVQVRAKKPPSEASGSSFKWAMILSASLKWVFNRGRNMPVDGEEIQRVNCPK